MWRLVELLRERGNGTTRKPVQVALNWLIMSSPAVIPIPSAKRPEQVDNLVGATGWRLSYSGWRLLEEESRQIEISYSAFYQEKETEIE